MGPDLDLLLEQLVIEAAPRPVMSVPEADRPLGFAMAAIRRIVLDHIVQQGCPCYALQGFPAPIFVSRQSCLRKVGNTRNAQHPAVICSSLYGLDMMHFPDKLRPSHPSALAYRRLPSDLLATRHPAQPPQ